MPPSPHSGRCRRRSDVERRWQPRSRGLSAAAGDPRPDDASPGQFAGQSALRAHRAADTRQPDASTVAERLEERLASLADGQIGWPSGECRFEGGANRPDRSLASAGEGDGRKVPLSGGPNEGKIGSFYAKMLQMGQERGLGTEGYWVRPGQRFTHPIPLAIHHIFISTLKKMDERSAALNPTP